MRVTCLSISGETQMLTGLILIVNCMCSPGHAVV